MRNQFSSREPFEPPWDSAARTRIALKICQTRFYEARWADRLTALFAVVRRFADKDEVDWYVTHQYNGRDTYYAAMQKLANFGMADKLKSELWRIGFSSWWEYYDAGNGRPLAWTDADTLVSVDARSYPWGMLGICDMAKPEAGKW